MIEMNHIRQFSDSIAREFQPEQIILFGSYAYGTPREDSDVDMLVILPEASIRKAVEILHRIRPPFAVDLITRTPEQVKQRLAWNDFFLKEIMERGTVLYAASNP